MGSTFTTYKSPALVNLDWTTTFTPFLLRKDLDLGLSLGRKHKVPMPVASISRDVLEGHMGRLALQGGEDLEKDFTTLLENQAASSGLKLESENREVKSGLELD